MIKSAIIFSLISVAGVLATSAAAPVLRLEGNGQPKEYDTATYNRVYFTESGMKLASRINTQVQQVEWPYTSYNLIRLAPTASVEEITIGTTALTFDGTVLKINASNPSGFTLHVYNISGAIVSTGQFDSNGEFYTGNLPLGIYFVSATNDSTRLTLKFIVK